MKFRNREINVFGMAALDLFASALGAFILIAVVLMPYVLRPDPEEMERLQRNLEQAQAAEAATRGRLARAQAAAARTRDRLAKVQAEAAGVRDRLAKAKAVAAATRDRLIRARADASSARDGLAKARAAAADAQARLDRCRRDGRTCRQEAADLQRQNRGLQRCRADLEACTVRLSRTFLAVVVQWPTPRHDVDLHIKDAVGERFYYDRKKVAGRPGELSVDTRCGPGVEIWEVPAAPPGKYRVYYNLYGFNGNRAAAVVRGGVYFRDGHVRFRERKLTQRGRAQLVAEVTVKADGSVEAVERSGIEEPRRSDTSERCPPLRP